MKRIHPKWFLCAIPALVGAFLFFCLPGYKFAGLALMGLSALIPARTEPVTLLLPWFFREIFVLYPQLFS